MQTLEQTLNFTIRRMQEADLPAVVDFHNECDDIEPMENRISLAEFTEDYHWPNNPEIYTIAHLRNEDGGEGKLVGYLECDKEDGQDMAWGELLVHPRFRNQGIGRALYDEFENIVLPLKSTELHFSPKDKATLLIDFLTRRGYAPERYFIRMRLDAEVIVPQVQLPEGFSIRTFQPGDEQLLTDLRNGSFAEHYGATSRTVEEMAYLTTLLEFRAEGLFFAFAPNGEPAAFCHTAINEDEIARRGERIGWVHTLGTMPAYQRRGLGRALLLLGVNYLRTRVPIVELGMEGKNAKAAPLYTNVGFRQTAYRVNMVKEVMNDE